MRGIDEVRKGRDDALMGHLSDLVDEAADGSLTFANFVEFDSEFGHRRNVAGYAAHLEWFSAKLSEILPRLRADDLLVVTADHGNDPTWIGTDHTRERVPVLMYGIGARELGEMSFADVGASVAAHLGVPSQGPGKSVL
jgi:phosphopentomutase